MAKDDMQELYDRVLFSHQDIVDATKEVARKIENDYAGKNPLVIGALKGAVFFMTDLLKEASLLCEIDFIDVSSYGNSTTSSGKIRIDKDVQRDLTGRDILIVEDIVDTGYTLKFMKDLFLERGAKSVKCAVLLDKEARRATDIKADYIGRACPDEFVVGYGLDFAGKYRNVDFIGVPKDKYIKELG
ncbi:MAG: hypoxanthine phosphoribosyltransferase [Lactobacillus sp.]|nr:hypoxanthine phosphoribosyltransferase [Lactobacillus sp.]